MKGAVDRAKPFVERFIEWSIAELPIGDARPLVPWISIATIMAEFTAPDSICFPEQDRKVLYRTKHPPAHWTIAVGRYSGTGLWKTQGYRHRPAMYRLIADDRKSVSGLITHQITTYTIGNLVVYACSTTNRSMVSSLRKVHPKLSTIFPYELADPGRVLPAISDRDMEAISEEFQHAFFNHPKFNFIPAPEGLR
jgi:hypothetical protein